MLQSKPEASSIYYILDWRDRDHGNTYPPRAIIGRCFPSHGGDTIERLQLHCQLLQILLGKNNYVFAIVANHANAPIIKEHSLLDEIVTYACMYYNRDVRGWHLQQSSQGGTVYSSRDFSSCFVITIISCIIFYFREKELSCIFLW